MLIFVNLWEIQNVKNLVLSLIDTGTLRVFMTEFVDWVAD